MSMINKLNESNVHKIVDAVRDADISRLMGNPNWRDVFRKHASQTNSPSTKKILLYLHKNATPQALSEVI